MVLGIQPAADPRADHRVPESRAGRPLACRPAGHRRRYFRCRIGLQPRLRQPLLDWPRGYGPVHQARGEGTGSYGAGVARCRRDRGVRVVEVGRPNRQVRRRFGKADVVDAIAAGHAVLSREATAIPKAHDGAVEALRALKVVQRSARKARTQALNQLRSLMVTTPDELRSELRDLPRARTARRLRRRPRGRRRRLPAGRHPAGAARARRPGAAIRPAARAAEDQGPDLVALRGVGPDVASTLLRIAGDNPQRLGCEKSFASLCGSSPLDASSGKQQRHRLNQGDDRPPRPPWPSDSPAYHSATTATCAK